MAPSALTSDDFRHFEHQLFQLAHDSEHFPQLEHSSRKSTRMVASVPRKHEKLTHQYHLKSAMSKGSMVDNNHQQRQNTGDADNPTSLPASCLPQRRYIVLPRKCGSDESVISGISDFTKPAKGGVLGVSQILDSFTYLCLGGEMSRQVSANRRKDRRRASVPGNQETRVVYPIASYPARLNSRKLIEQRRQSLPHNFFRPVPSNI